MSRPGSGVPDDSADPRDPLAPPDLGGPDSGTVPLPRPEPADEWFAVPDRSAEATGSGADGPLEAAAHRDEALAYEQTLGSPAGIASAGDPLDTAGAGSTGGVDPDVAVVPFGAEVPPAVPAH